MQVMQQPSAGAVGAPPAPPPPGPMGSPMAQPTPNDGSKQMGVVQVETAMQMLEQALPQLGSTTPEGAAVLRAMSALAKAFNRQKAAELVPAQIAEMARAQKQSPIANMIGEQGSAQPQQPQAVPMQ